MGLHVTEISEGVFYAQYIGWDPAMKFFRDRPNNSLVRVQVIKSDDGELLVALPHAQSVSSMNAIRLDAALKEWRFVRRIRMSTRLIPIRRQDDSRDSGRTAAAEHSDPVLNCGQTAPGGD
jgi:hypothetical protein